MTRSNVIIIFSKAQFLVCKEENWGQTQQNHHELTWPKLNTGRLEKLTLYLHFFFFLFFFPPQSETASRWAPYVLTVSCWESPGHISLCPAQLLQWSCLHVVCPSNSGASCMDTALPISHLHASLAAAHLWAPASHLWLWRTLDKTRKKSRTEKMQNHHSVQGWGKSLG